MKQFHSILRFIRMATVILLFGSLHNATAQINRGADMQNITLQLRDVALSDILQEIERQAGVTFSYESSLLQEIPKLSFQAKQETLPDCLRRLFSSLPIAYKITKNIVILKRKPKLITISGFVRDKTSDESLIGASVYEAGSRKGTATNNYGFFSITLPRGDINLQTSYIGYSSHLLHIVSLGKDTILNIELTPNAYLNEVVVTTSGPEKELIHSTQMGALEVSRQTIRATPVLFGEADLIKTLQLMPGVAAGIEGMAGMYVRGGNGDQNLFLIDGNPVYQVNHVGGIFSAFNPEAVRGLDFFKAGFPSRYGGRLSSVVDVHTKEGNMKEYHGSASIGLISGNLNLEGPIVKDRTSFHIALRRTWLDAITAPALAIANKKQKKYGRRTQARYAFHDLNLKLNHRFNDRSRIFLSLYNGNDMLSAGVSDFPTKQNIVVNNNKTDAGLRWGNLMATAGWTYAFNNRLFGKISGVYTQYHSRIKNTQEYIYGKPEMNYYSQTFMETESRSGITDAGLRSSFDYLPAGPHHVRFGADYLLHRFRPEYSKMQALNKDKNQIAQLNKTFADALLWANEGAVFVEDDWTLNSFLRVNAGLRFSFFNVEQKTYTALEPRVSLRWLLKDELSFKASYARMSQYVHLLSNSYINLPTDAWMPVTSKLKPLISDQVSAGFYYNLNNRFGFSVEGYYKTMRNLLEYKDGTTFLPSFDSWESKLTAGNGRAYGLEFMARKEAGRFTGWIGYSLAWADRRFPELNKGIRFPSRYDNRHKLNIVGMYKLTPKVELSAAWNYTSGNYITLSLEEYESMIPDIKVPLFDERNNFQLPDYHRLDLGVNIYRPKRNGRMGIWNISIYNAYCRMNPFTIYKRMEVVVVPGEDTKYVPRFKKVGLLPVIPSITYTYANQQLTSDSLF